MSTELERFIRREITAAVFYTAEYSRPKSASAFARNANKTYRDPIFVALRTPRVHAYLLRYHTRLRSMYIRYEAAYVSTCTCDARITSITSCNSRQIFERPLIE